MLLLVSGTPPAQAPDEATDARQVHWQRSLDDALALARANGKPLFLAINMDGESASDRIVRENYRDPAFVRSTRGCVCLGASVFRHNPRDHDEQGRRIACPRFGEITCGEHMALEPLLFEKYLADGERVAPRHALVLPDGSKAFDLSLCFDLQDIDRALSAALGPQAPPPPGLARDEQPTAAATWAALAGRRDCRGRAALEHAIGCTHDEAAIGAAIEAIAAHGDRGSLDALRILIARSASLPTPRLAGLRDAAHRLRLGADLFDALRSMVQGLGAVPGDPSPDARRGSPLVMFRPILQPDRAQLAFALAGCAVGAFPIELFDARELDAVVDSLVQPLLAHGGPVQMSALLQAANEVARAETALPRAGITAPELPAAEDLLQRLEQLDAEPRQRRDDPEWLAAFARTSLDLGRRQIEAGQRDAQLLLEDAARCFAQALERAPDRYEWWIERARTAWFLQRFDQQIECGRRALQLASGTDQLPGETTLLTSPMLQDPRAIEALRWIGDGHARRFAERMGAADAAEVPGRAWPEPRTLAPDLCSMLDGLRALGIVAASPFGRDRDWLAFASCCGLFGLLREEHAVAWCGARRYPGSAELRQELTTAAWRCGRPDLLPSLAESLARERAPSAVTAWHAGYAWILAAEQARRAEDPPGAVAAYDAARRWLREAARLDPGYRDSCNLYIAIACVGEGMAHAQAGNRRHAAHALEQALRTDRELATLRDGLGCDVLDLVDRILEWRSSGPSEVQPIALLDRLDQIVPDDPFWAVAVADGALREALRADGRNPEREERETVDAAGNKITMPMGLPTAEGDRWLRASIDAGRRAAARAKTTADRQPLAQSCTIWAERMLLRGRRDGVHEALTEAAQALGIDAPGAAADEAELRSLTATLRSQLGDARPRLREGR